MSCLYICLCTICVMASEFVRGQQILWEWIYRWLWVTIWTLGMFSSSIFSFHISHWGVWLIWSQLLCRVIDIGLIHSYICGHSVFPAALVNDAVSSPVLGFCIFVKYKMDIIMCTHVWCLQFCSTNLYVCFLFFTNTILFLLLQRCNILKFGTATPPLHSSICSGDLVFFEVPY